MRVALYHQALSLGARCVAAKLSPGDEELLSRRNSIQSRRRMLFLRLLKSYVSDFRPRQITDALA